MKIKALQKIYIQKSRLFLYPLLDIRRGVSVTPIQTYMSWGSTYTIEDCRLISQYYLRGDQEFKEFEKHKLLGNPLFDTFCELENDTGVYIFNLSDHQDDYTKIVNGKYSRLDPNVKSKILKFFQNQYTHHMYMLSYLEPDRFFTEYAQLLGVDVLTLKRIGELCSIPDLEKENLVLNGKITKFADNNKLFQNERPDHDTIR